MRLLYSQTQCKESAGESCKFRLSTGFGENSSQKTLGGENQEMTKAENGWSEKRKDNLKRIEGCQDEGVISST
jgi:hypothetical protein